MDHSFRDMVVEADVRRGGSVAPRRRAAMLLEVLISVAILVLAISTIGGQVGESLRSAEYTNDLNRAVMLTESVLSEMDLIMDEEDRLIDLDGEEGEGTFGERYPGFGWRIKREPTEIENLDLVTVQILRGSEESESVEDWKVLHSAYVLKLTPGVATIGLSGFGLSEEQLTALNSGDYGTGSWSVDTSGTGGMDASAAAGSMMDELLNFLPEPLRDPFQRFAAGEDVPPEDFKAAIGELTVDDLLGLAAMPQLLSMLGGDMSGLSQLTGGSGGLGDLKKAMQGGGGLSDLKNLLQGAGDLPAGASSLIPDGGAGALRGNLSDLTSNRGGRRRQR